jgi:hypothetical protein
LFKLWGNPPTAAGAKSVASAKPARLGRHMRKVRFRRSSGGVDQRTQLEILHEYLPGIRRFDVAE